MSLCGWCAVVVPGRFGGLSGFWLSIWWLCCVVGELDLVWQVPGWVCDCDCAGVWLWVVGWFLCVVWGSCVAGCGILGCWLFVGFSGDT